MLLVVTISYNTFAAKKKVPTISTGIRWAARHPFGAWVAGGVIGGLLAHWFLIQESEIS